MARSRGNDDGLLELTEFDLPPSRPAVIREIKEVRPGDDLIARIDCDAITLL